MPSDTIAPIPPAKTRYRPDIDGLRAVAVGAVVLDHAFPKIFPGGFIGVDIFYVISGYLITNIFLNNLREERFKIIDFYAHRIRRILPALFVVLAATTTVAAIIFSPRDLSAYGHSVLATALFYSNVHFYLNTGYFAPDAKLLPLLHTWSLAVEEQYYIFFPIFLTLLWKLKKVRVGILIVLVASFLLSAALVGSQPMFTFFLLPTRAWELLVGAIIAARMFPELRDARLREAASALGAMLIMIGFAVLTPSSAFPGPAALLPCVGAGLLIHAGLQGQTTVVGKALSFKPVVFIGLISYSLYLWHWPVISLLHYRLDDVPAWLDMAAVALSVGLAYLSWRFVERRFHQSAARGGDSEADHDKHRQTNRRVVAVGAVSLLVVAVVGIGLGALKSPSLVEKVYSADIALLNRASLRHVTSGRCKGSPSVALQHPACRIGAPTKPATVALWGDSYADALKQGLPSILQTRSAYGLILHSCPSILGTRRVDKRPDFRDFPDKCVKFNTDALAALKADRRIDTVILFNNYRSAYDIPGRSVSLVSDHASSSSASRLDQITDRVIETARTLKASGKTVILVGAFYAEGKHGAEDLARLRMFDRDALETAKVELALYDRYSKHLNDRLRATADDHIIFVDPKPLFCQESAAVCDYYQGRPPLIDEGHLNEDGAKRLASMIDQALAARGGSF